MRKRKRKIKINQITLLAIFVIMLVLGGVVIFFEKGIHRKEALHMPVLPEKLVETDMLIKGCLFKLGVHKDQVTIHAHTFIVESHKNYTMDQLISAFNLLSKYGKVEIGDAAHVMISINSEKREIEFIYGFQGRFKNGGGNRI